MAGFDDGLSALIALVMRLAAVDYATAKGVVHTMHSYGYVT